MLGSLGHLGGRHGGNGVNHVGQNDMVGFIPRYYLSIIARYQVGENVVTKETFF